MYILYYNTTCEVVAFEGMQIAGYGQQDMFKRMGASLLRPLFQQV